MSDQIQTIDSSVDLLESLLWQHDNAPRVTALLKAKQDWYNTNQSEFWENWVRDVFDLRTANAFGLKVWSIILGVPLTVVLDPTAPGKPTFGFGVHNRNFGHGNFSSSTSQNASLTLAQQRLVLQLRYFKLVSRCTVPEINRILAFVFQGQGKVYVLDPLDMTFVIYVFDFVPGSQLTFILEEYDLLPRPAGVGVKYITITRPVFGFNQYNQNFHNSTFAPEG